MRFRNRIYPERERIAAVLDVGTRTVSCLIARITPARRRLDGRQPAGRITVLGHAHQLSRGITAGQISDMGTAEHTIRHVVAKAERVADLTVDDITVTAAGGRFTSEQFAARVTLPSGTVTAADMARVIRAARDYAGRDGHLALHTIPVGYSLGYESGIQDPLGMIGDTLEVDVHALAADPLPWKNLRLCVERCHLSVAGLVAAPYASALAVISDSEADLGVICLDMGAGTTGVAVFAGGRMVFGDALPQGGNHITQDIAQSFSLSLTEAERMKTLFASAFAEPLDAREIIACPVDGERQNGYGAQFTKAELSAVVRRRLEGLFEAIRDRLEASGFPSLADQRLVLTGGASELVGAAELAAQIFATPARQAAPLVFAGLPVGDAGPSFAAPVGLLIHLLEDDGAFDMGMDREVPGRNGGYFARVGQWLRESF